MRKERMDKESREIELLEEMLKWARVASMPKVKKLLEETLPNDEEKIAYHFSDGKKTSRQVASLAGVSFRTVAAWWKIWYSIGIAEPIRAQRGKRAKAIFSLEAFNIKVPRAKLRGEKDE